MEKKGEIVTLLAVIVLVFTIIFFIAIQVMATSSGNSGSANLTIYDDTDPEGVNENRFSNMNVSFFANFTNSSGYVINSSNGKGNCQIQFNVNGSYTSYVNSSYNSSSFKWQYNTTFNRKGVHSFRFECNSTYGNVTVSDNFTISNTAPTVSLDQGGSYINVDGNQFNNDYLICAEDTLCIYNFTSNVTEIDSNDVLTFSNLTQNTTLTNFTFNSNTGILQINVTANSDTGEKQIRLQVEDSDNAQDSGILRVNISQVNDAPRFTNMQNKSFNMSSLFGFIILASDEEVNTPFSFNITFIKCNTADWSDRNNTNCNLFNSSQYSTNATAINISFTPSRNDVGNYTINFTVKDLNNNMTPYNASSSVIVNFTVLNVNSPPYFRYVCNNERNTTEGAAFTCRINASDIDETRNLTFTSNETWFLNSSSVNVNSTFDYNGSILINFTPTDINVGNWSINITVRDTETPIGRNSTTIWFSVGNVNDSVRLEFINNFTGYTSNNYTLYINATDDDLLISDKNVYNETLRFYSNASWLHISTYQVLSNTNVTVANISFNPNDVGLGNHSVNITVVDFGNNSKASQVFVLSISGNTAPIWFESTITNYLIEETTNFYHNYSADVNDSDGNNLTLTFYFVNESDFPSFIYNASTGIVNFTPIDADVGRHYVFATVTDGIANASLNFSFSINNTADTPVFELPLAATNASVDSSSNINASEDNYTVIEFFVHDDDFKIPLSQKSYYNESLSVNLSIVGFNRNLFSFVKDSAFPTQSGSSANRSRFTATFSPNKTDTGKYNITINVSDQGNLSVVLKINLTVLEINHAPSLLGVENITSSIRETLYLDFNVSDTEDINDSFRGGNLTYTLKNLTARGNFLTINSTSGVVNLSLNQTFAGVWSFNISVNDTGGKIASSVFNLTVYDYPVILNPPVSYRYNLVENISFALNFTVNHTVQDNLNYTIYFNSISRNSTLGRGNGTEFIWNFSANFSDETTCSSVINFTLNVSNSKLSNSTTWNLTINHSNAPILFASSIGGVNQFISGTSPVAITLSDYFGDVDASDSCYNQTIGFIYTLINSSGASVSVTITNWTNGTAPSASFSASGSANANYTITAFEYNSSNVSQLIGNASSNNFTVNISVTTTTTTITSSGGGGSSKTKKISLRIIVPAPIFAKKGDKINVPILFENDGEEDLKEIDISNAVLKNSSLINEIATKLNITKISDLKKGKIEKANMYIEVNTGEVGRYDIRVSANAKRPVYSNWEVLYLHILNKDIEIEQRIVFTEEFIDRNPECAEIKEIILEAKKLYEQGSLIETSKKLDEAIESCKKVIAQPPSLSPEEKQSLFESVVSYSIVSSLVAFVLGIFIYYFNRYRYRKRKMIDNFTIYNG